MEGYQEVYDISVSLGDEAANWPGDLPFSRELTLKIEAGKPFNLSKLTLSAHLGTHVDTPVHFVAQGKTLDDYPIERWIVPAHVASINSREVIQPADLANLDLRPGDALLLKTLNSTSGLCTSGVFSKSFVHMSAETADFCVARKLSLVGIDYASVDKYKAKGFPAHHKLLENEILILEGINLKDVPPGRYTLFCLPLKIKGAEGAPARAILVR